MLVRLCISCVLAAVFALMASGGEGPFNWMGYDNFDLITDRMDAVNLENCKSKPASALMLPSETLAQVPRFNKLLTSIIYPNRTLMLHQHNMALNRAFFYSYIFQKLNYSDQFYSQPGLMYFYFSAVADVSANEYNINGSAVFFDNNCSYPNWYRNLPFNETLPLFGPRAWRLDDYNEPTNWNREPTNRTVDVEDYGAGPQHNYTIEAYKINQWYSRWLPDGKSMEGLDSVRKHSYDVGIKYSNETGKFTDDEFVGKVFFGPPSPGQKETEHLPVVYTQPFFDCGRSNRWIVSAVSPIVDQLPRYLDWLHLRRMKFVAVSTMDMEFLAIDMNPCPLGIGNQPPNFFHGIDRCKQTTMCEPLYGWGFRRGGYQCVCKPGYRLPPWQQGPYQGIEIESATESEYKDGFNCVAIELKYVIPKIDGNSTGPEYTQLEDRVLNGRKKRSVSEQVQQESVIKEEPEPDFVKRTNVIIKKSQLRPTKSQILNKKMRYLRSVGLTEKKDKNEKRIVPRQSFANLGTPVTKQKIVPRYQRDVEKIREKRASPAVRDAWDDKAYYRMLEIFKQKDSVNEDNCFLKRPEELELPGDVAYGVEKQFSSQARVALRLSHFLSNFMQNIDMYEEYGNLRGDKLLNVELLFGEALANVMGDLRIRGSGIFYDVDKFRGPDGRTRQFFGPYAYRYEKDELGNPEDDRANTHFRAIDFAGFPTHYLDQPWFKNVKERWQSNTYGLDKFTERPLIRSDLAGTSLKKFELYPLYFRAPKEEDGWWSAPYFDCNGHVNEWILSYSIPFFGLNSIGSAIEFKGVVRVDVKLDHLDIDQCPMDFHVPNAFKDTARCHFDNTYCIALPGQTFRTGAYKCECSDAFEYPYEDRAWYFDGQTMEEEYRKLLLGIKNRYRTLKCRISGASHVTFSWLALVLVLLSVLL